MRDNLITYKTIYLMVQLAADAASKLPECSDRYRLLGVSDGYIKDSVPGEAPGLFADDYEQGWCLGKSLAEGRPV